MSFLQDGSSALKREMPIYHKSVEACRRVFQCWQVWLDDWLSCFLVCVVVLLGARVDFLSLCEFAVAADGPGLGVLLFPEICMMELQLLATGSPDLEVLNHVFHSLLGTVQANRRNAALLYEQVRRSAFCALCITFTCFSNWPTILVRTGRSQNHPVWLSQDPQPKRPFLYRFVVRISHRVFQVWKLGKKSGFTVIFLFCCWHFDLALWV